MAAENESADGRRRTETLGLALMKQGKKTTGAIEQYHESLGLDPDKCYNTL